MKISPILIRKTLIILYTIIAVRMADLIKANGNGIAINVAVVLTTIIVLLPQFQYVSNRNLIICILGFMVALIPAFSSTVLFVLFGIYASSAIFLFVIFRTALFSKKQDKHIVIDPKKENCACDINKIFELIDAHDFYKKGDDQRISLIRQNAITGEWGRVDAWFENDLLHLIGNEKHLEKACSAIVGRRRAKIIVDMGEYVNLENAE